jgi:hypothetical protein
VTDAHHPQSDWLALPVETEIYLLPDGRVVVADLPAELVPLLEQLGVVLPCAIAPDEPEPATGMSVDAALND